MGSKWIQGEPRGSQGEPRGTKESQGEPRRARWHQLQSILISQKNIPNFLFVNDDFLNLVDWSMLLSTFCCMAPYQGLAAIPCLMPSNVLPLHVTVETWLERIYNSQIPHSRFGHYFCSNLYGRAPRGPRGVKKSQLVFYK